MFNLKEIYLNPSEGESVIQLCNKIMFTVILAMFLTRIKEELQDETQTSNLL